MPPRVWVVCQIPRSWVPPGPSSSDLRILLWKEASLIAQLIRESACNAGDLGSIPGLGRSPLEGKGYPCQYSGLGNSMECIVHGVAKTGTQLGDFHLSLGKKDITHVSSPTKAERGEASREGERLRGETSGDREAREIREQRPLTKLHGRRNPDIRQGSSPSSAPFR